MKKALVLLGSVVLVVALVLWVGSWFRSDEAVATSGARAWPGGMGTLASVAGRHPRQMGNDAAARLSKLAAALPENEGVDAFVWREVARRELAIGTPPAALPDVAAIRELLLRERVVWPHGGGVVEVGDVNTSGMRVVLMTTARALVASALNKARTNDAAGWEDLHAVWKLSRSLDADPQMMMRTAALTMARMVNAVAWKMPQPAPDWFREVQERDYVRPLLEAFQYQTASYWKDGAQLFPTKWHADSVEHDRRIAETVFGFTACDINVPVNKHGSDLTSVWRRAFRFRAEREAAANAMRIRAGKAIESKSVCSDGAWTFDGTTLRFNRELETSSRDLSIPLVLRLKD